MTEIQGKVIFRLKFKASTLLDDVLEYVRKVKEAHPDAKIYVVVGDK